jgi:hypothetical protein
MLAGTATLTLTASAISPCLVSASDIMMLTINNPQILANLSDDELNVGAELNLLFSIGKAAPGIYAWYHNGVLIEDEHLSQYNVPVVSPSDAGEYFAVFTNDCGEVKSDTAFIKLFETTTMQINLQQGWSGISSYLQPDIPDMDSVFEAVLENVSVVSDQYDIFWPLQNINTLVDWSVLKGYKIKMNAADTLIISGKIQYPSSSFYIPGGWSYLPVNSVCPVEAADIFKKDSSNIFMIKEIAGWRVYWPDQGVFSLEWLMPGEAYEILKEGTDSLEISYPACTSLKNDAGAGSADDDIETPWNEVNYSASSQIFGFTSDALEGFESGDVIGAFDQFDRNVGIVRITDFASTVALAAFIDDEMTSAKDGMLIGEEVVFKMYRPSTNEVYNLEVTYSSNSPLEGKFAVNGISLIQKATFKSTSIGLTGNTDKLRLNVFPNPVSGVLNVSISSERNIDGTILLFNSAGQGIFRRSFSHSNGITNQQFDLSGLQKGVYYLKLFSDKILKVEKIIVK